MINSINYLKVNTLINFFNKKVSVKVGAKLKYTVGISIPTKELISAKRAKFCK